MDEELKVPENLSLEEARQQASFEILTPEYIPEGYVLNSTIICEDNNSAPEDQGSETVILSYQKGTEVFEIRRPFTKMSLKKISSWRWLKKSASMERKEDTLTIWNPEDVAVGAWGS